MERGEYVNPFAKKNAVYLSLPPGQHAAGISVDGAHGVHVPHMLGVGDVSPGVLLHQNDSLAHAVYAQLLQIGQDTRPEEDLGEPKLELVVFRDNWGVGKGIAGIC